MHLIYLDYNCFQRGFDDLRQTRIHMEALACQEIFIRAESNAIRLVWSFMHEDETFLCPFPDRKIEVMRLSSVCTIRIGPNENIFQNAKKYQKDFRLFSKDAVHLACAVDSNASHFITCDDGLLKHSKDIKLKMSTMNPVDYIRNEVIA